jgi:hypothetical protein
VNALRESIQEPPDSFQGVSKQRIAEVLRVLALETEDCVDVVFALLDDEHESWFAKPPPNARFCHGASVAHIACHVGIMQRGRGKLDREGRDYWLKPLRDVGAVEPIYLDSTTRTFLPGHPVAKSPNSAHRLAEEFRTILRSDDWRPLLRDWAQEDRIRQRLVFQGEQSETTRTQVDTKHVDLIRACCELYVPRFLPGYSILFVDDADGDRVTEEERERLRAAGLELSLQDAWPDVLLWNEGTDSIWVIEAVTSDGEVDEHKARQLRALAERSGKVRVDFTTAYPTWKLAAQRQARHKNIADGSHVWIREDPSKHYLAEAFPG